LGAERHLDLELVAVLTQLRQELLDGIENPTAADKMLADTAVLAYRNVLRIQGWIGSLCLVMERELFGQEPVSELNGATVGERIEREMHQFEQSLMPLLDRAHRMLVRSLDRLEARRSGRRPGARPRPPLRPPRGWHCSAPPRGRRCGRRRGPLRRRCRCWRR
jgi:hypothetical protein